MLRKRTGEYRETTITGETVRAFIPDPLPPQPPIDWNSALRNAHDRAIAALARLDGMASILPDAGLFIYSYVRKEALLSSQIEGTQSTLTDIFAFESGNDDQHGFDDVKEVSNYVAAQDYAIKQIRKGMPVCNRLIRETHRLLLSSGRGSAQLPGEFRRSQNWIGGTRPSNAKFVPPPHEVVADCLAKLEEFINQEPSDNSAIVRAALAHVQFETIHPFLDGNGRTGRLLITVMLIESGMLREPLLYLSLYFKLHRSIYYELLEEVRRSGDWERWLAFFFEGVEETAKNAANTAQALLATFESDRLLIQSQGRIAPTLTQVHLTIQRIPVFSAARIVGATGLTMPTVNKALQSLIDLGIVKEVTGRKRDRLFAYAKYLHELDKGTEPL